jgi:hypothetical protein
LAEKVFMTRLPWTGGNRSCAQGSYTSAAAAVNAKSHIIYMQIQMVIILVL